MYLKAYVVYPEEAERHDVSTPLGPSSAGAAARRDPAAIKHHRHVVRTFGWHHLWGYHSGAQMETCKNSKVQNYPSSAWETDSASTEI